MLSLAGMKFTETIVSYVWSHVVSLSGRGPAVPLLTASRPRCMTWRRIIVHIWPVRLLHTAVARLPGKTMNMPPGCLLRRLRWHNTAGKLNEAASQPFSRRSIRQAVLSIHVSFLRRSEYDREHVMKFGPIASRSASYGCRYSTAQQNR